MFGWFKKPQLTGWIDIVDPFHVTGWAAYPGGVQPLLNVEVDGIKVGQVNPKYERQDLRKLYGDNTALGFLFTFAAPLAEGSRVGLSDNNGQTLPNSPQVIAINGTQGCVPHAADDLTTPIPDENLIFLVNGHWSKSDFAQSRRPAVDSIVALLDQCGIDYRGFHSILDFGCGCGRILAGWEPIMPSGTTLLGCDINAYLIDFCRSNIPFARTWQSDFLPPLDIPDTSIDLVYSASVFTHVTHEAVLQWAKEMHRIIRPGGGLLMSYNDSYSGKLLEHVSPVALEEFKAKGFLGYVHGSPEQTFLGSNDYATFMSLAFVDEAFNGFERLGLRQGLADGPTAFAGPQDMVVLRRL